MMLGIFYVVNMNCSTYRSLPSFSRNPFICLFVLCDSWYFCLGEISDSSKENEKAEPCPDCVAVTVGDKGVTGTPHPSQHVLPLGIWGHSATLGHCSDSWEQEGWDVLGVMCRCLLSLGTLPTPSQVAEGFSAEETPLNEVLGS